MELTALINAILANKDEQQAIGMSAYMRDQFQFLGISTPLRQKICKPYFKQAQKAQTVDWGFINTCWANPYRELQYVAKDYLVTMQEILTPSDIPKIRELAVTKSWWDTIDGLDRTVGDIAYSYPKMNDLILQWSTDENFWLRRIAIDHQLSRKEKTDVELLGKIIENNFESDEFFINKAIGWALREYSKTNPQWVKEFIEKNNAKMAKLSIREASKYIDKPRPLPRQSMLTLK